MSQALNERDLIHSMMRGRNDFTGCTLEGPIDISCQSFGYNKHDDLIFNETTIIGEFFIGDLTARSISFERVTGDGKIGIYRSTIDTIHGKGLEHGWFTVTGSFIEGIDLLSSVHKNGFMIKRTPLQTLILDSCVSPLSLFEESDIKEVTTFEASLGRRHPVLLGELPRVKQQRRSA